MTDEEKMNQREAMHHLLFVWQNRYKRQEVTTRQIAELAEEEGISWDLRIRYTSLDSLAIIAGRMATVLGKFHKECFSSDGRYIRHNYMYGQGRRYYVGTSSQGPTRPPMPKPPPLMR